MYKLFPYIGKINSLEYHDDVKFVGCFSSGFQVNIDISDRGDFSDLFPVYVRVCSAISCCEETSVFIGNSNECDMHNLGIITEYDIHAIIADYLHFINAKILEIRYCEKPNVNFKCGECYESPTNCLCYDKQFIAVEITTTKGSLIIGACNQNNGYYKHTAYVNTPTIKEEFSI
jgi:hypothetical protein